jgi:subtilase family serine protease
MLSRLISRPALPLALYFAALSPFSHATVQDRVATVSASSRVTVRGNVSGHVKRASDLGLAPQDRKLESLSLRFSMTPAQQADLTQLLAAQLDPSSPNYHKWLTPEQFGARFGLSSGDLAKVSSWITSQGFTVTATARSSTFITFTGTVAQAQQAFGTSIHSLTLNGEQHIANVTDPVLPSPIAGVVNSVTGLDDFRPRARSRVRSVSGNSVSPSYTLTNSSGTSHFIAPADFYTIYDVNPLLTSSINGTGFTVAVVGQTALNSTNTLPDPDVTAFRTAAGLTGGAVKQQLYGSINPGVRTTDIDEAHIDVEWSGAAAPAATILFAYGNDVFNDALTGLVDGTGLPANSPPAAPIISSSYGNCESVAGTATLNSLNLLLQQANTEGITIISSSGDAGAADCDTAGLASEGLNVDFPSSSPFVTSAGGTMFSGDAASAGSYWNTSNGSNGASATSYIPEQPWNETTATAGLDAGGAGGGGASAFFTKPAWQVGTGVPNDSARDVPDISLNAAANHDGYLVCSHGSSSSDLPCSSGFLNSSGEPNVFGGTSFVAPTFAGILALVEQKLGGSPNVGLGNINPILYGLASGPNYNTIFHDILTGNNSVPCSQGTPNCPSGGAIGFTATPGYDQASGLGTIDAFNLVNNWNNPNSPPTGTGSAIGKNITTTALTTTTSQLCAISGNLPLSATVTTQVSGSAAPTGTVQFLVDNAVVGTAPISAGIATYTLNTSTVSSGGHTISAVYLGDTVNAGSKGTLLAADPTGAYPNGSLASVDIVSSTKPDFSLTPCVGSTSVLPGATAPGVTFTISPLNGFTGPVTLTTTNNDSATATTSFTVTPVTLSSAGVATSFVIKAFTTTTTATATKPHSNQPPSGRTPWYVAGSGATLACMVLLTLPRRRRWGALLAAILSVAAITVVGCSNTSTTGNNNTNPTGTTTPAAAGTYTFTVTAVSNSSGSNLVHSATVTLNVQ